MKIVTNNNYCVKCHLVGDYSPPGNPKALAPQLGIVYERLRPDYVHDWIANPKRFLPYTGMPVNIPHDKPVSQDLYAGDSEQQVAALTDLLMHFDEFVKQKFTLEAYLPAPAPAAEKAAADGGEKGERVTKTEAENGVATPADRSSPVALPEQQSAVSKSSSGRLAAAKMPAVPQEN
jgi:hypothetical protein